MNARREKQISSTRTAENDPRPAAFRIFPKQIHYRIGFRRGDVRKRFLFLPT